MVNLVKTVDAVIDGVLAVEERIGDFIANGPGDGLAGHVRDGYRTRCDQFANLPAWARGLTAAAGGGLGRICEPYYAARGFDGPSLQPPATGGQCVGVSYWWDYQTPQLAAAPSCNVTYNQTRRGPYPGPLTVQQTAGAPSVRCDGLNRWTMRLLNTETGAELDDTGSGHTGPDGYRNVTFVRVDGQADTCGDPPGDLQPGPNPPPDPGPTPGPEPTDDPNNPTGPPLLPIPDYDDPIGGPTPVEGPEQNPDVGPGDPVPGNPDTSPGSPDAISPPVAVDPGPSGGGDTTSFGEPPAGRAWIGCFLVFDFPPAFGGISGSEGANLVSPRVFGNGSLVYEGGRGNAEKITSEHWQLFRPSGALAVTGVFVNVDPGFSYTVRPVSIELCPENNCGAVE